MTQPTRHFSARMSQRGVTADMIDFVLAHGAIRRDKVFLRRKELERLLPELAGDARATAIKLLDKGGLVIVEEGGSLITTYNYDSYDRRRRGQHVRARRPSAYR